MAVLRRLAGTVTAEQQLPVLGLTYLPFVDDNRKARTKSRSSQNTSSVRCFPLVANLLLQTGSKEFSKAFLAWGLPTTYSGKKPGSKSVWAFPGPLPKISHEILTLWVREMEFCPQEIWLSKVKAHKMESLTS